jgi:hypothetical protein
LDITVPKKEKTESRKIDIKSANEWEGVRGSERECFLKQGNCQVVFLSKKVSVTDAAFL